MLANSILVLLLLQFCLPAYSQRKVSHFDVLRNGSKVGTIKFTQTSVGMIDTLEMESNVQIKFVSTFKANGKETAIFHNGILLKSSIYRELNGKEKANKKHEAKNNQYIISKGRDSKILKSYPISYNMLSLYAREPVQIDKVYSDNFESFISIQKMSDHKYKIILPDGDYNNYTYKDGELQQVEIHQSLYSAIFVRAN